MDTPHAPDVLVICQTPELLAELMSLLVGGDLRCLGCGQQEQALAEARQLPPRLIICDTLVESSTGAQLCEQIRRQPGLAEVPLIFLSAAQGPDVIRRRHAGGGVYHVRKPFDPQVLLQLARRALGCEPAAVAK